MMINIAICDDEEIFLYKEQELISKYMERQGYSCNIDLFLSGEAFLEGNDIEKYDIVFLDVSMGELDGMETAKRIRRKNNSVYLVFVTAYITYSTEGYKVDASRYILKNNKMFETAIEESLYAIIQKMGMPSNNHTFSFQEGKMEIKLSDIIYVESNLHKLIFHMSATKKKQYTMYEKLDVIDAEISHAGFCRIHKSYLVNMKYANDIERYKLSLSDGTNLSIAKTRYPVAKEAFAINMGVHDDGIHI